ncbi:MAG: gamma carbonic anhydrase family protein [Desulfobulbaceae bacterium]|nr:MAG: gamma carbonic anhydrase family protein [Desulfobulbaceae bacterium]
MKKFKETWPQVEPDVFIGEGAQIIGAVIIGRQSSVFFNSVVRGDVNSITIGHETNIQDNCTLHVTDQHALEIGTGVTVGHNAVVHGCRIHDHCLIGIGAIILDGAEIGENSIVAAGSLVPPGKVFPAGSMIMGSPAKRVRALKPEESVMIRRVAENYRSVMSEHKACAE